MLTPETKAAIDKMTVEEMLRRQRYAPAGDPMFFGEVGAYFQKTFAEKRAALRPGEYPAISKKVGWNS